MRTVEGKYNSIKIMTDNIEHYHPGFVPRRTINIPENK